MQWYDPVDVTLRDDSAEETESAAVEANSWTHAFLDCATKSVLTPKVAHAQVAQYCAPGAEAMRVAV